MIPRLKPNLGWKELFAALQPPREYDVERFEEAFAKEMDQKYAVAFPYGRTALLVLLDALEIKGKEIICPAYTCVVVAHAIVKSGNKPVFVDCEKEGFNMALDEAESLINENTAAIIPTSLFGYPVDLDKLDKIRERHPHIHIIQDCAHSFLTYWKGRPVHKKGIAAFYGMNISKLMTAIFGGMVTTDNLEFASKLRASRDRLLKLAGPLKSIRRLAYLLAVYVAFCEPVYTLVNWLERKDFLSRFVKYYDESKIDLPQDYLQGMSRIEARVGLAQVRKLRKIIESRQRLAKTYHQSLSGREELRLGSFVEGASYSHFVAETNSRSKFIEVARVKGVQLGELIEYSIPDMRAYQAYSRACPRASSLSKSIINLPVWFRDQQLCQRTLDSLRA